MSLIMKRNKISRLVLALMSALMLLLTPLFSYASTNEVMDDANAPVENSSDNIETRSGTPSLYNTFGLDAGQGWYIRNTSGKMIGNKKETTKKTFSVVSNGKTMWSSPSFRLADLNNTGRSETVSIEKVDKTYAGTNYFGEGDTCYASVKPSSSQLGYDTITLKFNPQ